MQKKFLFNCHWAENQEAQLPYRNNVVEPGDDAVDPASFLGGKIHIENDILLFSAKDDCLKNMVVFPYKPFNFF